MSKMKRHFVVIALADYLDKIRIDGDVIHVSLHGSGMQTYKAALGSPMLAKFQFSGAPGAVVFASGANK